MYAERARLAALHRHHHDPDHPAIAQARRELALATTEHRIREAIENAPPLSPAALARLRELIPAGPTDDGRTP